jgi:ABC-type taurine transport system substrate-binding protein
MRTSRRWIGSGTVIAVLTLLGTACGSGGGGGGGGAPEADATGATGTAVVAPTAEEVCANPPAPEPLDEQTTVTVAMPVKVQNFNHILLADALGELEKENIQADIKILQTPDILVLLAQGKVDVGAIGLNAGVLNAVSKDVPIRWVSGFTQVQPSDQGGFYVRSDWVDDPKTFDMHDLVGKKVAIGVGGLATQQILDVKRALARDGVTLDDVKIVELESSQFGSALQSRAVDAVVASNVQQILDQKSGVKITGIAPITAGGYFFGRTILQDHRDVGLAVMRAMVRTQCEHLAGNYYEDPAVLDALVEILGIPEKSVLAQPPLTFDLKIADGSLQELETAWREQGNLLQYDGEIDPDAVIDESFYAQMVE